LKQRRVFITGTGIISPLGFGAALHVDLLKQNRSGIKAISLFTPSEGNSLPAGEVPGFRQSLDVPRTHELALLAAQQALVGAHAAPDAIIIGTTTGGMPLTEQLLRNNEKNADRYRYHSTSSVAEFLAEELRCKGLILTITTACSSGAAALKLAYEHLIAGKSDRVLAGGADALCRLTYYGFNSLQLIDPNGARPLDRERKGMTVAEGAAMLMLEASESFPGNAIAELLGGGLSCDAYHPATPHPEGAGALAAMKQAIQNAGISAADIDYINFHGTGTKENDLSEAKAVCALFGASMPPLSSIKGATGHTLAASGAIEAVVCAEAIRQGFIPPNTGCTDPDPELNLKPVLASFEQKVTAVLSNSFGFGGNNACLVLADHRSNTNHIPYDPASFYFEILGSTCITGAGGMEETVGRIQEGRECAGVLATAEVSKKLPAREIRRLKRLPRLALSLAMDALESCDPRQDPSSVFFGTSWGPLSETYEFLTKLFETNEEFTSPTEFVGSVHNAPAGQAAIMLKSTGANITATGGDYSFEQALFAASLAARSADGAILVMGADEYHPHLSPLFDKSAGSDAIPSDGGGAFLLRKTDKKSGLRISPMFFENSEHNQSAVGSLLAALGGPGAVRSKYGALFAGKPLMLRAKCDMQINAFLSASEFKGPIIDYRKFTGEFGSASAAAAALAARLVEDGHIPLPLSGGADFNLAGKGILLLGLGTFITAVEILA
jgi:3-oxoacyl-(acyl-carrier-protein) synthase